jgi:hypothetical protein
MAATVAKEPELLMGQELGAEERPLRTCHCRWNLYQGVPNPGLQEEYELLLGRHGHGEQGIVLQA